MSDLQNSWGESITRTVSCARLRPQNFSTAASGDNMRPGPSHIIVALLFMVIAVTVCTPPAMGQAAAPKPLMSDQFFKNVQVLKGIPVDQFMDTMGMFSAALTLTCSACHVQQSLE